MGSGAAGAGRAGPAQRRAERRWVFGSRAASSPGWSSAPPRPLPPACAAGSGGGGAARGQAEALDVGRRRGQGRADGRWQRGQRRGPLGVAAVRAVALPSCSAAVSATGGPQGCVCIPVFPGPGPPGPSGRVSVRGSVYAWGYRCFSESVPVSVHVRRVHVRESSGGILRAVAAHVRYMFEGGDAGGWVMVPWRSAGFRSLCMLVEGVERCGRG